MSKITATLADPADKGLRRAEQKRWHTVPKLCSPFWQVNPHGRQVANHFSTSVFFGR
jgi:hypothetical protein